MAAARPKEFYFTEAEIRQRFQDIYYACRRFVETRDCAPGISIDFDPAVLYLVTVSTYHDVARFKNYHFANPWKQKSDAIKRAAYFTRWFVHLRPIYTIRGKRAKKFDPKDDTIILNEAFAIGWSLANIAGDLKNIGKLPNTTKFNIHSDTWQNLVYDLKFRDLPATALINTYQLLFDVASGKKVILY